MKWLAIMASAGLLAAGPSSPDSTFAHEATITGTIAAFDGKYELQVRDERGSLEEVTLHRGTVITPTGQHLTAGLRVTITGTTTGSALDADQIDVAPEDADEYSPGPYTPLVGSIGSLGTSCNSWNCGMYGSCGGYAYGCYGAGYSGYYPAYSFGYVIPFYAAPPVFVVPAPSGVVQPTPAPFRQRRPLDMQQRYFPVPTLPQFPQRSTVPSVRRSLTVPVYHPAPVYRPAPVVRAAPRAVGPHR